jgi:hypothetical protein
LPSFNTTEFYGYTTYNPGCSLLGLMDDPPGSGLSHGDWILGNGCVGADYYIASTNGGTETDTAIALGSYSAYQILSVAVNTSPSVQGCLNYATCTSHSTNVALGIYPYIISVGNHAGSQYAYVTWWRTRQSAPNNQMPTYTYSTSTTTTSTTSTSTTSTSTTSSTTSTAGTTIPYTTASTTISQDEAILNGCTLNAIDLFACPFNIIPDFAYLLILLGFLIGYFRSLKVSMGIFVGMQVSFLISAVEVTLGVPLDLITVGVPALMLTLFVGMTYYEIFTRSGHKR